MIRMVAIAAVIVVTSVMADQGQDRIRELVRPPPIDPALTNRPLPSHDGPIHEFSPSALTESLECTVLAKGNRSLWPGDFTVEIGSLSANESNLVVNLKIERKFGFVRLDSVDLVIGGAPEKANRLWAMLDAELFVPLWRSQPLGVEQPTNTPVCAQFVISRELAERAFLRLKGPPPPRERGKPPQRVMRPSPVYLIDLDTFVPEPPPPPTPGLQDGDKPKIDLIEL